MRLTLVDRGGLGVLGRNDEAKALLAVEKLDLPGSSSSG